MLILTRKSGQMLTIHPQGTLDLTTPIGELFRAGPIEVIVSRIDGDKVRIGINAHPDLLIARSERETEEA
jgi:sRNA-binding carbon storage regulator CsrA